ncbi:MAG: family transcriptional regulator, cyclic receptor protein [Solirubrobacteraceae bacterium]|jgi:CRP-like cAMP-binding protein|nr:family transcriptional regulator, cyclic receptor protein [Solirubrobacteraceae bacterium]
MDTAASIEETFAAVPLLARLSRRQRSRLAALATARTYPAEAVIVRQGDTSMSFYVVLSGHVRVERREAGDGRAVVRTVGPAGWFGEMGLIDDLPRSATVVAIEPTVCALLAKWDFASELRDDPDIALSLLPVLTQRIRELELRLERHGVERAEVRT